MNMSFQLTTDQMLARTKTVTRRLGWGKLTPGTVLTAVEKSQGLKKGEHPRVLGRIEVVTVRREPLLRVTFEDVVAEGFPGMGPQQFIQMFCRHMKCRSKQVVTRIEFRHV